MTNYDNDPRYKKVEDNVYFDTLTEETVLVLATEDRDSPGMQELSGLMREQRLAKEAVAEERRKAEALEEIRKNDEGFSLFVERTAGLSLEVVRGQGTDEGDLFQGWDEVVREQGLSADILATTFVLGPPEEMLRLEKNPELRSDEEFLNDLRSRCLLFVMPHSLLFASKYEWTLQAFGVLLKRTNFNEQRALNGWDVGRTPMLGNHPSIPTVVDEELLELPNIWSPAGSRNHFFSMTPQQLLEITDGKAGPRSRQYL